MWLSYWLLSVRFGGRAFVLMLTIVALGVIALIVFLLVTQSPLVGES